MPRSGAPDSCSSLSPGAEKDPVVALKAGVLHLWRYCRPFYAGDDVAMFSSSAMRALWPVLHYLARRDELWITVPQEMRDRWAAAYYATAARSACLSREVDHLLSALQKADIPVILLKGAILAENLYPNPALRPMGDLDLLLRREDLPRLHPLLESMGYIWDGYQGPTKHLGFDKRMGELVLRVEAHWHLISEGYGMKRTHALEMEALWDRAVSVTVGSKRALALSPEDTLLHLCLHQAAHALGHVPGYLDMHLFIHEVGVEWEMFVQRVVAYRLKTVTWFALSFARTLLGTEVPQAVLDGLQPSPRRRELVERFVTPAGLVGPAARPLSDQDRATVGFLLKDRWRDTLLVWVWMTFLPDRPRMLARYPWATDGPRLAWAYARHLARLAGYGMGLMRRVVRQ